MRPHISIKQTEVSKFLPFISRHFMYHRAFAMYYLIMAQRPHKVLIIIIHDAESEFILVKLSEKRIGVKIIQGIMHPTNHPFHSKSHSICYGWFVRFPPVS